MGIKIVTDNRKAWHDYEILEKFEAGIVLVGSEVKSLRNQQISLKDSYVSFRGDEAFLQHAHISEYKQSGQFNHEPERLRKLLLSRIELNRIYGSMRVKGYSCIPLKVYFKKGIAKVEIALAKGKQKGDKRESIKTREANRDLQRQLKHSKH